MTDPPETVREALSRTLAHAMRSDLPFTAAGIAYYAQVSLVPLGVLAFVAVSTVADDELAVRIVDAAGGALSPSGEALLRDAVTGRAGRWEASLAGLLVLSWGSLRLFRGLKTAFSDVYDDDDSVAVRWTDSAVAALAVPTAVVVVLGAGVAVRWAGISLPVVLRPAALGVALTASLWPLFYVLPEAGVTYREALPGAVLAAGGWILLRTAFRAYVGFVGSTAVYGALGAVVLLVTWLYLASLLLVAGAVLNVVLAGRDPAP